MYNRRNGVGEFINQPNTEVELGQIREAAMRAMFNFTPSDDFSLLLSADFSDSAHGQSPTYFNAPPGQFPNGLPGSLFAPDPDDNASPADNIAQQTSQAYGVSATADWNITDAYSAKFIGSYRFSEYTGGTDQQDSLGAIVFPERGEADQYSAEIQFSGDFASWNFVTGAYYYTEDGETVSRPFETFPPFVTDGEINVSQEVESWALFGSVDYSLTDSLVIGGGVRVTDDSKDAAGVAMLFQPAIPVPRSEDWTEVTWDASATYSINDDLNFYVAISRGYQSGGFPARPFGGDATFVSFDPQFALNYEGGIKGVLFDRLRLATTIFRTDYTDLQLQTNRFDPNFGFLTITENAGESRTWGVEFEGKLQVNENFSVQTAVGYMDSEFTEVDPAVIGTVEGGVPQLTPDWTFSISPEFVVPMNGGGSVAFRLNYNYRGDMYGEANNNPLNRVESRELLDFNIRYQPGNPGWHVAIYGENVLNEVYDNASGTFGNPFSITIRSNDRSEFGVRFFQDIRRRLNLMNRLFSFEPYSSEFARDPYSVYARMREECPVRYHEDWKAWLISRYDDIKTLVMDDRLGRTMDHVMTPEEVAAYRERQNWEAAPAHSRYVKVSIIDSEGELHSRLRKSVFRLFTIPRVNQLRGFIQDLINRQIDTVVSEKEFDFIEDLVATIPGFVIGEMLGVPGIGPSSITHLVGRYRPVF